MPLFNPPDDPEAVRWAVAVAEERAHDLGNRLAPLLSRCQVYETMLGSFVKQLERVQRVFAGEQTP